MAELGPVKVITIPEQKQIDGQLFPYVLSPNPTTETTSPTPNTTTTTTTTNNNNNNNTGGNSDLSSLDDTLEWIHNQTSAIQDQLLQHGAILFRGFPLKDAHDFDKFVTSFGMEPLPYVGGAAPRKVITKQVFTANEAPPDEPIPFHHEMAQVPTFPSVLYFFCDVAPSSGGQTPLVLSHYVYREMLEKHPQFVKDLEDKLVTYTRVLPNGDDPTSPIGRGWQSTFQTEDRDEAERKCKAQGTKFEWLPDGCLKTTTAPLPAIREDTRTGKKMWFNSIIAAYLGWVDSRNCPEKSITFADGTPMPRDVMLDLEATLNRLAADVTWQKGDVFMVDNRQVLHARRSFSPPRRILAALAK